MAAQSHGGWLDRVALVIGNSEYQPKLPNPVRDAALVTDRLVKLGFHVVGGAGEHHDEGENLDRGRMLWLIDQFLREIPEGGTALIYYAGHGLQLADKNYLLPIDADLDAQDPLDELVPLRPIVEHAAAKAGNGGTVLMFLDACRNNPFSTHQLRDLADRIVARSVQLNSAQPDFSTLTRGGLATIKYKPSPTSARTFIAFATAPGDVAYDGDPQRDRNSPFAAALGRHMHTRGLDLDGFYDRVALDVRDQVDHMGYVQDPWRETNLSQPFYFMPRSWQPVLELTAAGLVAGLLACLFLFDPAGRLVNGGTNKHVWLLGFAFALVAVLGTMRWGSRNAAHAAVAGAASMAAFGVALALLHHPDLQKGVAAACGDGITRVGCYFSSAEMLGVTLMALLAGVVYGVGNALGCKPQFGSFRGFGAVMGGIGIGLLVGVLYVLFLLLAPSAIPKKVLMVAFGAVWFACLGFHLGYCFSYYVPEHRRFWQH